MKKLIIALFSFVLFCTAHSAFAEVSWNTASNDCRSIAVANYTTNNGIVDPCWPLASVTASPGNSVNVRLYYHNTGSEPATNVRVVLSAPTINTPATSHSFSGQIISDQRSISFGPVYVNLTTGQKLSFGSTRWYPNQTQSQAGFLYGQDGSELINNGLEIGTIDSGWTTQGSVVVSFYVNNPAPTGSLTVSKTSCSILAGQNSCTIPFSWSTSYPIGTSSVTRDGASTVGNGNSATAVAFTVPYPGATFRLYNNSIELDAETVTASCASGTNWNSSINSCEQIKPTGNLVASSSSCVISAGQSSCSIPFSWTTNNPIGSSIVTRDGGSTVGTGNYVSYVAFTVPYPGATFRLSHNSLELDVESVTASCAVGTSWNNSTCALPLNDCEISSFTTNKTESAPGSVVTLSWTTKYCSYVNISNVPSGTNLNANGSKGIWPTTTATYVLTGVGSTSVSPTRQVTVMVGSPVGAPGFPAGAPGFGY